VAAVGLALGPILAAAGEPVTVIFAAPIERVWTATLAALEREGWGVDDAARPIGLVTTRSERLEGYPDPVFASEKRVRLRVRLRALDDGRTSVSVEPELFRRERTLWLERDQVVETTDPLVAPDRTLERAVLAAIGKAL
jgi:hypothetical protein